MSLEFERLGQAFVVLTCEHAGNVIPVGYETLFEGQTAILQTHRAYDLGALDVALKLASQLAAPLQFTEVTRLLVDANRSPDSEQLFSEFTRPLSSGQKQNLLDEHYWPHRSGIEKMIAAIIQSGQPVLHIAVHSFVDELDGETRGFEIGLLFDPQRANEVKVSTDWREAMASHQTQLKCVSNQPYLGTDDGLTTSFRQSFDADWYAGIEVEIRQGRLASRGASHEVAQLLATSLQQLNAGDQLTPRRKS